MTTVDVKHSGATTTPEDAGLDPDAVATLVSRAERDLGDGGLPSCQLALARNGEVALSVTLGDAEPESRYVMFSCTKALTGSAVWLLIGRGLLDPTVRAAELIPEFATNGKDVITVEQLLTHTGGFPYAPMNPSCWLDRQRRLETFSRWTLNWEPGSRFEYHTSSAHWVLAEVIEVVTGTDFRDFVNTQVCEPLGLDMRLGVKPEDAGDVKRLVPIGRPPTVEELAEMGMTGYDPGEVTAENVAPMADPVGLEAGVPAGGAATTAADLARFYQALLHNDPPLWDPEVLRRGTAEVVFDTEEKLLGIPANRTLGITLAGDDGKAALRGFGYTTSGRAFGHGGAGGQIGWADPETGLSFAYLTNGFDEFTPHVWRRIAGLSSKAGACVA